MPVRLLFLSLMALCLFALGCAQPQPETVEVPVTVEVLREVPVTVEVEREVEVTREVEVPVTVEVLQEVTREVTVEVTREVPVVYNTPTPIARLATPTLTPSDSMDCQLYLAEIQHYFDSVLDRYEAIGDNLESFENGELTENEFDIRARSLWTEVRDESSFINLFFSVVDAPEVLESIISLTIDFSETNVRFMSAALADDVDQADLIADELEQMFLAIDIALTDPPDCG